MINLDGLNLVGRIGIRHFYRQCRKHGVDRYGARRVAIGALFGIRMAPYWAAS